MVVLLYIYICYIYIKKTGKESQYMVSHPELDSDAPIGSDRESGCDRGTNYIGECLCYPVYGGKLTPT